METSIFKRYTVAYNEHVELYKRDMKKYIEDYIKRPTNLRQKCSVCNFPRLLCNGFHRCGRFAGGCWGCGADMYDSKFCSDCI